MLVTHSHSHLLIYSCAGGGYINLILVSGGLLISLRKVQGTQNVFSVAWIGLCVCQLLSPPISTSPPPLLRPILLKQESSILAYLLLLI